MSQLLSRAWHRFFAVESSSAVVLALATVLALVVSNSPGRAGFAAWLAFPNAAGADSHAVSLLAKSLHFWINDGLMAIFFFAVGLEIKREMCAGELAGWRRAMLPAGAALGGIAVPALIYISMNHANLAALRGWAIPSATDIAFACGMVVALGSKVPSSLKVFLTAVAIMDDLGAIAIIAFFYTAQLSWPWMGVCLLLGILLYALNRCGVQLGWPYAALGGLLWAAVFYAGVHPTLAGVVTAMAIPLGSSKSSAPLEKIENALHPWVAYGVLPLFALANAGVALDALTWSTWLAPVTIGVAAGLVVGKAVGVFGASYLLVRFAGAQFPQGASRWQFFGMCCLCGIGFTMSLFIGTLAFAGQAQHYAVQVKFGVLGGSVLAACLGALVLWCAHWSNHFHSRNAA
jgi:Na+:H+ antiporter, NhaA family